MRPFVQSFQVVGSLQLGGAQACKGRVREAWTPSMICHDTQHPLEPRHRVCSLKSKHKSIKTQGAQQPSSTHEEVTARSCRNNRQCLHLSLGL